MTTMTSATMRSAAAVPRHLRGSTRKPGVDRQSNSTNRLAATPVTYNQSIDCAVDQHSSPSTTKRDHSTHARARIITSPYHSRLHVVRARSIDPKRDQQYVDIARYSAVQTWFACYLPLRPTTTVFQPIYRTLPSRVETKFERNSTVLIPTR